VQNFKPLLAETANLDNITFPVFASPKLDGIRAFTGILPGLSSRTLKAIPNRHIQAWAQSLPPHLDGELLTYTNGVRDDFNTVQSKVMSHDGAPEFTFHVFDNFVDPDMPFHQRLRLVELRLLGLDRNRVRRVPHVEMQGVPDLVAYEREQVETHGWEGIMIRDPQGRYKFGRSTVREAILLKVKRFDDAEAVIVGFQEEVANTNEAVTNALGHTERSGEKAGMVRKGTLGALHVIWGDIDFSIGTGFTAAERADMWAVRDSLMGQKVTFKFQGVGSQGRPRFPSFVGIRRDL
jgi:DNA ligase-1